ncbi:MAG TPA: universal stress protein [Gaiellaceae bacterium]|nr:universal stress protein [Gaiellaceae bacterium]
MARKLPRLQRVLDLPALASIAYSEIASSIYFALGIIAEEALGLTPALLLVAGLVFLLVALSYAEGTAAIPETGGAATFTRIAFNDFAGFATGWALFLDYLIVIALSAVFLPHYLGYALHLHALESEPWDVVAAVGVVAGITAVRLVRRPSLHRIGLVVAIFDVVTQVMLVVLGFAFLFSTDLLTSGISVGAAPSWHGLAFALPLAMLAYTGLETVANLAEEAREPGRDLPRTFFSALSAVVVISVLIAIVGLSAFPVENGDTALGTTWGGAPLMGIVSALRTELPVWLGDILNVYVGVTGALILLMAATTSVSGIGRLSYSLGEHGQLPRRFGLLNRRTLTSPDALVWAAAISILLIVSTSWLAKPATFLASLYSFGVLLAFTAAQLAVIKLRVSRPELPRPFRVGLSVRVRGADIPLPAVVGAVLTFSVWIVAMVTHPAARYAGPAWLAVGIVIYLLVRRSRGERLTAHVVSADEQVLPETQFSRILVPMKLGEIGEEMVATAVKLAQDSGATVDALHVIRVPMELPLDAELAEEEQGAADSLLEAQVLGEDHHVEVVGHTVRARAIGEAIVKAAAELGTDLIVLGSSPRWRRQSRFFSPTVEYVLRTAPCEVLIVAFPQGILEEAQSR